jgi:hypothetical protein
MGSRFLFDLIYKAILLLGLSAELARSSLRCGGDRCFYKRIIKL